MTTALLIQNLAQLTEQYGQAMNEESIAVRTAQIARAISMQDRKIALHEQLFDLLEKLKAAPKSEDEKNQITTLVSRLSATARDNKKALELGFGALDRISKRIMSAMRNAVQKDAPNYTAAGRYHAARRQPATVQTDTKA